MTLMKLKNVLEEDGKVIIQPLLFNTVLNRAKSRLFKLYEQIKEAPFLKENIDEFLNFNEPNPDECLNLLDQEIDNTSPVIDQNK